MIANRYHIDAEIGGGGMGTVYKGFDTQTRQTVAIKRLKPELAEPELIERFKREGEALRELNHPNIVKMLDAVQEDGSHYLIIEYLSAGDLNDLLKRGKLPLEQILQLVIDICDALTRAHRLNIIHRDLKPANVLIAADGTPRLTDFGIAYIKGKERVTASDAIIGTVEYLAPEILDGAALDPRVDVWAFGVMLFEMLAGKRPFMGDSVAQIFMAIMTQPTPDLEKLCPDAPIALVDLVYRMLEKDPHARIASVRHVGAELEDILHGRSGSKKQAPDTTRFATPTPDFLHRPKHNLPAQTTPFVGREAELIELAKLLDNSKIRLITIVAQGGMGKTRLALELAEKYVDNDVRAQHAAPLQTIFSNGVYFVELAPLSDHHNIVSAIADATSYQFQADGRDQKQQILDFLGNKNMLLVLDNYEHLLEGAPLVTDILKAVPQVKILATSRQRLNQSGETVFNLQGMDFPTWETPADALEYAAVKLFLQGATRPKPDFEITADNMDGIARICKLVQGMPLGILLAASWVTMLSPDEIAAEIAKSIDFLASDMSDMPARQRSMRAVFDYSWDLLTDDERDVFAKLSVFRGGFTREAAEAVAGANLRILMNLMNKSLLRRDSENGRYDIHELLRQYGEGQLIAANLSDRTHNEHMNYYADFMYHRKADVKGQRQLPALREIEVDFENVRLAWNQAVTQANYDVIDRMIETLILFCDMRTHFQEGLNLVVKALETLNKQASTEVHPVLNRVRIRWVHTWALEEIPPTPREQLAHSLKLAQAWTERETVALCLWLQGEIERIDKNYHVAITFYEQAIAQYEQIGDKYYVGRILRGTIYCYNQLGGVYLKQGGHLNRQHIQITRSIGDKSGLAHALLYECAYVDFATAEHLLLQCVTIAHEMGDWKTKGVGLLLLAEHSFLRGMFGDAEKMAREGDKYWLDIGRQWPLLVPGLNAFIKGDFTSARQLLERDLPEFIISNWSLDTDILLVGLATAAFAVMDKEDPKQHLLPALQFVSKPFVPIAAAACLTVVAIIMERDGEKERAVQLLGLVSIHSNPTFMGWAEQWSLLTRLQENLKTELDEDTYNSAWEHGKTLDIETVVKELLVKFGENPA